MGDRTATCEFLTRFDSTATAVDAQKLVTWIEVRADSPLAHKKNNNAA